MKGLYEITYYKKAEPGVATVHLDEPEDVRRKVFAANAYGFRAAVQWAEDHTDDVEFIGSVKLVAVEHR